MRGSSLAGHSGAIHNFRPLLLIGGNFNVVTIGTLVTVPEEQPGSTQGNIVSKVRFTLTYGMKRELKA